MNSKQVIFFIVLEDIVPIIKSIEQENNIKYSKTGLLDFKDISNYKSMLDAPELGFTQEGDWNRIDSYLVVNEETTVKIREIPQRKGGIKYAVDQLINPESIAIKFGGVYKKASDVIIAGRLSTVSTHQTSLSLYKMFYSRIKKDFRKIDVCYVGKNAEEKLKLGWRLVLDERRSKENDLAVN